MTSKRQFLDPIGASCRLILLQFSAPRTKIRITDHTIQLVEDGYTERMFFRPWVFRDSREDMSALYPMIVRFIELYLNEKKSITIDKFKKGLHVTDTTSHVQQFNFLDVQENIDPVPQSRSEQPEEIDYSDKCYEYLKKLAEYMIKGMSKLGDTYGLCNAAFTLQFYCNLLRAGIDGTYSQDLLPEKIKDFTAHNLLNSTKIKNLWSDSDIVGIGELFEKCFESHKNNNMQMIYAYGAAITAILDGRDEDFKNMMLATDCA